MSKLPTLRKHPRYTLLLLALLPVMLTSCTVIVWQSPVSPLDERAGEARLPGAWSAQKNETVYIGKPVEGWMSFVYVNTGAHEQKLFGKMYASRLDGRRFLNVKFHDPDGNPDFENGYLIAEYRTTGKKLWVSSVDEGLVKQAVDRNQVQGTVSERDSSILVIRAESAQVREFIRNNPAKLLFPFNQKEFLKRIR